MLNKDGQSGLVLFGKSYRGTLRAAGVTHFFWFQPSPKIIRLSSRHYDLAVSAVSGFKDASKMLPRNPEHSLSICGDESEQLPVDTLRPHELAN